METGYGKASVGGEQPRLRRKCTRFWDAGATNAAKRLKSRKNVVYQVFKLIERLSQNWRMLKRRREAHAARAG